MRKLLTILFLFVSLIGLGQVPFMIVSNNCTTCNGDEIIIGTQTWKRYNLNTDTLNDGTYIPNITDGVTWAGLSTLGRCYYNNDSLAYASIYGALYNWYAVNTGKLCPTGYHVSTDNNWYVLANYVDVTVDDPTYLGYQGINVGYMLKSCNYWNTDGNGLDEYCETNVPSGIRHWNGLTFINNGNYVLYWASDSYDTDNAYTWGFFYNYNSIYRHYNDKNVGCSVRCIKD